MRRMSLRPLALNWEMTRRVLHLAYPVMLGTLSFTLLSVVDTALLGRLGSVPLAAAGVAGVLFFAVVFPLSSAGVGVQALTARRFGERNEVQCGHILRAGLALALLIGGPLVVAAPWIARFIAPFLSQDPEVVAHGTVYVHYRLFGAGFMFVNWVFRGFFTGIGETRQQMIGSIIVTATNVVLDYLLIFGRGGFPRLGIQGAAIASTIALAVGTVYFVSVSLAPRYRSRFLTTPSLAAAGRWIRPITRLSLPVAGQRIVSGGSWFIFFAIVARIGTLELAASTLIRSIWSLPIMLGAGLGTAAAALVGQQLGAEKPDQAEQIAWEATKLAAYLMGIVGLLFMLAPTAVILIYTSDPDIIAVGRLPLIVLGIVQPIAGVGLVLQQSLQGAGNTRFVMLVELVVCLLCYIPVAYFLGLRSPLGLMGAWTAEYLYWGVLALFMVWKFRQGAWKQIVV